MKLNPRERLEVEFDAAGRIVRCVGDVQWMS